MITVLTGCNRRLLFISDSERRNGVDFTYSTQQSSVTPDNLNLLNIDAPPWEPESYSDPFICVRAADMSMSVSLWVKLAKIHVYEFFY